MGGVECTLMKTDTIFVGIQKYRNFDSKIFKNIRRLSDRVQRYEIHTTLIQKIKFSTNQEEKIGWNDSYLL